MTDDLAVGEIIGRVLKAGRTLESCESKAVRVTDESGHRSEIHSRSIQVGNDGYDWSSKSRGRLWGNETLFYNGEEYFKDEDGAWKTSDKMVGSAHVMTLRFEGEASPDWNESLVSSIFHVDFNRIRDAKRLPNENLEGRSVLHLTATEDESMPALPLDKMREHMPSRLMSEEDRSRVNDEIDKAALKIPDSITLTHDLWIDAESCRVLKMEMKGEAHRAGKTISSFVETRSFSKFNEAELPGPLPD